MDNLLASKQARLNHLDLYKGICILFIIITHYEWTDEQRLRFFFPFWIDMAVPVFMVITYLFSTPLTSAWEMLKQTGFDWFLKPKFRNT